jgi:hypothetical protein
VAAHVACGKPPIAASARPRGDVDRSALAPLADLVGDVRQEATGGLVAEDQQRLA